MQNTAPLVLVLEDDQAIAEALCQVLESWGARSVQAPSLSVLRERAGQSLGQARFIITDFHLEAGPDGVCASTTLLASAPQARVLVVSGAPDAEAAKAALEAGFSIMQKPASAKAIIDWLERR